MASLVQLLYPSLLCLVCVSTILGFGTDPEFGRSACLHLYPSGHEGEPQSTPSPYVVTVSGNSYNPGDLLIVTISSIDGRTPFRGFILQARSDEDPEQKVGDFIPNDNAKINCVVEGFGGKTVTHVDPSEKTSLSVTWIAPALAAGDVQFRATIIETFEIYWMDITSDVISGPKNINPQVVATTTKRTPDPAKVIDRKLVQTPIQASATGVDLSNCGMSKGCYRSPKECTDNCEYILTWTHNGTDLVQFELQGTMVNAEQYISMALSHDLFMDDDSVTECLYDVDSGSINIQQSYNERGHKDNSVLSNPISGLVANSLLGCYSEGVLTCRFARYVNPPPDVAKDEKVFGLNRDYHIFLAKGPVKNGMKGYHGNSKIVSGVKVNMATGELVNIGGTSGYPLIKAHGILMILAWMVCASFAALMPRYCKKAWPGKKIAGIDIWFRYEQLPLKAHPPLGIVTTILLILNPIMAVFRPAPTSSKRPIFNMLHFLVGLAAHILSVATMYIGIYMSKAAMPVWSVKIMGAYVVWHVVIEIALTVNKHCFTKSDTKTSAYVMKQTGDKEPTPASPAPNNVGTLDEVKALLGQPDVRVDCLDQSGMTPLQQAAYRGKNDICKLFLAHGADINSNHHQHGYTALMFAALSGQSQCTVVINNFIPKSDIEFYCEPQGLETEPKLPPHLCIPLYELVKHYNIHPVKTVDFYGDYKIQDKLSMIMQSHPELLDEMKKVQKVLDLLVEKMVKRKEVNEVLAIKFHYMSILVQECDKWQANKQDHLKGWIRRLCRGTESDGFLETQEKLIRSVVKSFPYLDSQLLQQIVKTLASVEIGDSPTALSVLNSALNGQQFASNDDQICNTCGEMKADKKCSACKSVFYCNVKCQKLDWTNHKKFCKRLQEERKEMEERKKQEEDINKENEPESIAKTDENESRLESNNITKLDEDVNSKDNKEDVMPNEHSQQISTTENGSLETPKDE
ncbi:hypothetical protein LSH36_397g02007 [Paralvinella palmiformis]|uniref:Ferric-chelate reductase 1 n=1 Tax=Paralvinella palmiformis TaxID=53620 RepID=A0AAD9MYY7_9ANNE|nr:hypothetical protein LSH36_397g02007 [Paralvinella palmiformis]